MRTTDETHSEPLRVPFSDQLGAGSEANPGIADKGPWEAMVGGRELDGRSVPCAMVCSNDFEHDVWLYVVGDFADIEQAHEYAKGIAQRLNATTPNALLCSNHAKGTK